MGAIARHNASSPLAQHNNNSKYVVLLLLLSPTTAQPNSIRSNSNSLNSKFSHSISSNQGNNSSNSHSHSLGQPAELVAPALNCVAGLVGTSPSGGLAQTSED